MSSTQSHDDMAITEHTIVAPLPCNDLVTHDSATPLAKTALPSYAFPSNLAGSRVSDLSTNQHPSSHFGFSLAGPLIDKPISLGMERLTGIAGEFENHAFSLAHVPFEYDLFQNSAFDYGSALPVDTSSVVNGNFDDARGDRASLSDHALLYDGHTDATTSVTPPVPDMLNFLPPCNDSLGHAFEWTVFGDASPLTGRNYELVAKASTFTQVPSSSTSSLKTGTAGSVFHPIAPAAATSSFMMPHATVSVAGTMTNANQVRIHCTFPGCTRTFKRAGDCRRHMGKHQARAYNCIETECEKRFYRLDKLRDHLRQGHGITL